MTVPALIIVTSSFPINGDGSEAAGAFVADLAEEVARYLPVRVVAPGRKDGCERWNDGVDIFRYAAPKQALSTLRPLNPRDAVAIAKVMRAGALATQSAVEQGPTAHVVALWALPCGHWARRSAIRHHLGYSVWTLGSDIWSLGRIPLVRTWLGHVLAGAECCWSDGLGLRDETQIIAGRKVEFLPSTRRLEANRDAPVRCQPPFRLLFLGRWHPNKGVDLLMEALALLDDADWRFIDEIHIAGGGPLHDLVVGAAIGLQAQGRPVRISGYLDHGDAHAAFAGADRLLLPSRIESIPVVFSDAMKFGLPVISTPVGDLPALISQGTGTLAATVDPASYASAIRVSLESDFSPDALHRMAEKFSLARTAATLVAAANRSGDA